MKDVLGYARYVNYKGDPDTLTKMSLAALEVKKKIANETGDSLEQYMDVIFTKPVSLENEKDSWYLLLWKI